MIIQRSDDTDALLSSINVFQARVSEGLVKRLAPELIEGERLPDFRLSLDLVGRSTRSALEHLRTAEKHYLEVRIECTAMRRKSERVARHDVYPRVVSVRRMIESQFGREAGREVHGMVGKTLRKPRRLYGQLMLLIWALEDGKGELTKPLHDGKEIDHRAWLREVRPGYDQLTELLDQLTHLEYLEKYALDAKHQAMKAFDVAYGESLRLVQATYAFAGYGTSLNKRLRSYLKRRMLSRRAREQRQARAEGRVRRTLRSAASTVADWIGGKPTSVA